MGNFNQNYSTKSGGVTQSAHLNGNLRYNLKQKSHSIESQSKLHGAHHEGARGGQFSFDLDDKENYPSNSSLH